MRLKFAHFWVKLNSADTFIARHVYGEIFIEVWNEMEAGQQVLLQEDKDCDPHDETIILDSDRDSDDKNEDS